MVMFFYSIMCLIFGTTFLAIKIGLEAGLAPYFSAGIRFFIAGLLLIGFCYARGMKLPSTRSMYFNLLIIGFCLTTCTFATLYWAEQFIPSSLAALLSALSPMVVTVMLSYKTRTNLTIYQIVGLLLGFSGVLMITLPSISFSLGMLWLFACISVVVGQLFYSTGTVRSKEMLETDVSPFVLNGIQMMFGGIMLLILSLFTESPDFSVFANLNAWYSLVYLTVIGSLLGHSLYYWLIKKTNPVFPSTWLYVSPFIALIIDLTIRHEPILWYMILGGVAIIIGVIITNFVVLKSMIKEKMDAMRPGDVTLKADTHV
ncbi:hypothetical protein BHU72_14930 [Desulfuribacillus stibiiarsenatis]|uniref:EamA domain-containing protein n=1 Tax=Desulfuribacillus stibiiarsenatis TaxID=1390249 RepID=A0A1E5L775_9FIRM|nr:EamA family transporter [Desulfuribacillus stibiiarsenatis]OEH85997.1 hypothetical protein BHU72_14930 [Desulfuribacillus stibiiarsenatis]